LVGLELKHVSVGYGSFQVIRDVSLSLLEGEFLSLIGPNGAGKTTLIHAMSGGLLVSAGKVYLEGKDITRWRADRRARAGIGRSFQRANLFPNISALENVKLAVLAHRGVGTLQILRKAKSDVVDAAFESLRLVGLERLANTSAASLSHGDKRKLELAMLLALQPRIILLDEPTAGMSLAEAPVILDLIAELKDTGRYGMVLVEHKLVVVMRLSSRVAVLHQGELLTEGSPEQVMNNPEVERAYLGGRHDSSA
jgi:branched-chain amino acid transport system ATP-binding protein